MHDHGAPEVWEIMTLARFWQIYSEATEGQSGVGPSDLEESAALQVLLQYPAHLLVDELAGREFRRYRVPLELQLERICRELECRHGDPATYRTLHEPPSPERVPLRHIDARTMRYIAPTRTSCSSRYVRAASTARRRDVSSADRSR